MAIFTICSLALIATLSLANTRKLSTQTHILRPVTSRCVVKFLDTVRLSRSDHAAMSFVLDHLLGLRLGQ